MATTPAKAETWDEFTRRHAKDALTVGQFGEFYSLFLDTIGQLKNENAELKARVSVVEQQPKQKDWYQGVWQRAVQYQQGQGVTYDGSTFVALRDSRGLRPDDNHDDWQLSAKGTR